MTIKNKDIIPIVYVGGTGGNFLCYLLTAAKLNIKDGVDFSKYGNAHYSHKEMPAITLGNTMTGSLDNSIFELLSTSKPIDSNSTPPYFYPCHMKSMNRIIETFEKSIQITFARGDVDELVLVYFGKWWLDTEKNQLTKQNNQILKAFAVDYKVHLTKFLPISDPSILSISWHDLYRGDATELIQKLSNFTSIPKENFLIDKLIEWRRLTKDGIEELSTQINELNKI